MFGNKADRIKFLEKTVANLEARNGELESKEFNECFLTNQVRQQETVNKALAEENRELVRTLELYKALLAQIRIDIKLPERKK